MLRMLTSRRLLVLCLMVALSLLAGCSSIDTESAEHVDSDKSLSPTMPMVGPVLPDCLDLDNKYSHTTGIKDFCFARGRDGKYHVFHITHDFSSNPPQYATSFGHSTSRDMFHWTEQASIDFAWDNSTWANCRMWAPHVVDRGSYYIMYYTGVEDVTNELTPNNVQRIGAAISADLNTWYNLSTVTNGVILEGPSAPWSDWGQGNQWSNDCRDPFVVHRPSENLWYLFATIRQPPINPGEIGPAAIAYATSSDGITNWNWQGIVEGTQNPGPGGTAESPCIVQNGDEFVLLWSYGSDIGASGIVAGRSENIAGPYTPMTTQDIPRPGCGTMIACEANLFESVPLFAALWATQAGFVVDIATYDMTAGSSPVFSTNSFTTCDLDALSGNI